MEAGGDEENPCEGRTADGGARQKGVREVPGGRGLGGGGEVEVVQLWVAVEGGGVGDGWLTQREEVFFFEQQRRFFLLENGTGLVGMDQAKGPGSEILWKNGGARKKLIFCLIN